MIIKSETVQVTAKSSVVLDFLKNTENIFYLLPVDQITDWKSTLNECSFKVQGGIVISLIQIPSDNPTQIKLKSGEKSPFPFTLTIHSLSMGEQTEGFIVFDGELNMFLKMLVEKPLTALFNIMSENLKKYFIVQI
jgi:hypothetical protein